MPTFILQMELVLVIMAKLLGTALPFMRLINLGGICGRGDPHPFDSFPFSPSFTVWSTSSFECQLIEANVTSMLGNLLWESMKGGTWAYNF